MDKILMIKQIAASILSQDELVFVYKKPSNDKIVVRYATPIELEDDTILCAQHLPEMGWRRYKLDNIQKFHRVITRNVFPGIDKDAAKKAVIQND